MRPFFVWLLVFVPLHCFEKENGLKSSKALMIDVLSTLQVRRTGEIDSRLQIPAEPRSGRAY